jgi:hypothetical protein
MDEAPASETELAALQAAWRYGVPPLASAVHARWWQFESWLRELIYVELQALRGRTWEQHIPKKADRYASSDEQHSHMNSPDVTVRLAYFDIGELLDLIDEQWDVVRHGVLDDLAAWKGRVSELNKVRRGVAHCRRPNRRDLDRIEFLLADIDQAAAKTIAAFNDMSQAFPNDARDPLVDAWVNREHQAADRLIDHCEAQYDIRFDLWYSARPWANELVDGQAISGTPGYVWHASWAMGDGPGDACGLWDDHYVTKHHPDIIFFRASPTTFEFTFPAVSDVQRTADAIGNVFDAIVSHRWGLSGYRPQQDPDRTEWYAFHEDLDWRVHTLSRWTTTHPTGSVFGVGCAGESEAFR